MAAWMIPCDLAEKRSFSFQIRFAAAVDFVCYDSSHLLVCQASLFFVFRHHRRCGVRPKKKEKNNLPRIWFQTYKTLQQN